MASILVAYASDSGRTRDLAGHVAQGAREVPGVRVRLSPVAELTASDMADLDGLLLGSPVHMGSVHWEMKRFIDRVVAEAWTRDRLVGAVGGVFATGGGLGGAGAGAEFTMLSMLAALAELGVTLVPVPRTTPGFDHSGIHWGAYARSADVRQAPVPVSAAAARAARHHGASVARTALATVPIRAVASLAPAPPALATIPTD